jgi:hypothetical protein
MLDRDAVARWPDPPYTCRQASSYDRKSKTPDDPAGWFANQDWSHFLRSEQIKGRCEWVLMDADGPGCIVRQWWGGKFPPKGAMLRFYLDGADEPAIEGYPHDLLAGGALVGKPLSMENGKAPPGAPGGMNLYLPIPYARHCKITYSEPDATDPAKPPQKRWYNIEYRTYPAGTKVKTFTMAELKALSQTLWDAYLGRPGGSPPMAELKTRGETVAMVCQGLIYQEPSEGKWVYSPGGGVAPVDPGRQVSIDLPPGPGAVRTLLLNVNGNGHQPYKPAMRSTVLRIVFDGEESVWCPLGDFMGMGAEFCLIGTGYRGALGSTRMYCGWVMPYQKSASITVLNLGQSPVSAGCDVRVGPWTWDARSMHFHAAWRQERGIPTRPYKDWNYVAVAGKGVYMGDTLAVFNPVNTWWGEGDEKIWVDGESFPSHFGTGTEDYYGYSYGNPTLFQGPFCCQPRVDGPGNAGHTTNTRTRILDAIPFEKSIKVDMEIWHWKDVKVNYAVTSYWYALPGATSNRAPQPEEAAAPIPHVPAPAAPGP